MKKNDVYKVNITDVTSEGVGICRVDGAAVFVQDALKDEIHKIKIVKTTKNISYGKTLEIEKRSPYRTDSGCDVSGKCGGCTFRHVSYEGQLLIKQNVVETALRRIGHTDVPVEKIIPSDPYHYRNKAQYPVGTDKNGRLCFGFYAKNSHDIVPHRSCLLHDKAFFDIASSLLQIFAMNRLTAYDETTHTGLIRHITMRKTSSGDIAVCVVINGTKLPQQSETANLIMKLYPRIKSFYINENKEKTNVIFGNKYVKAAGEKYLTETLCGKKLSFAPSSFLQVNADGAEKLYSKAKEYLALKDGDRLIDLYCGVGAVGICSAGKGKIFGVEINPDAVDDARYNSLQNGREDDEYVCADAKDALKLVNGKEYQALVIDPPRKGIDKELIDDIVSTGIEKVVYISCDPATLARDIAIFETKGYKAVKACPVDMFPGTGHVETVVLLSRNGAVHHMQLNPEPYEMIKSGQKTIELRLFDEKRQKIREGDKIVFTNTSTGETMQVTVMKLYLFDTFDALYKSLPLLKCGYSEQTITDASSSDMEMYYSAEQQRKYGVVGIELFA